VWRCHVHACTWIKWAGTAYRPERPHTTRDSVKENTTHVAAQPSCTMRGSPCTYHRPNQRFAHHPFPIRFHCQIGEHTLMSSYLS
jgi:hypothetical protein